MKIETKLNVDKKAYFLLDNKVVFTTISSFNINVEAAPGGGKPLTKILYNGSKIDGVLTSGQSTDITGVDVKGMDEELLFSSKKELIASL